VRNVVFLTFVELCEEVGTSPHTFALVVDCHHFVDFFEELVL
jgi:hypothetical protein